MNYENTHPTGQLPWYVRTTLAVFGIGLIGMLVIAMCLTPSAKGYGTHTQMGLKPCSFTALVGIRCPSCGMTTSWAHYVRGNWVKSVQSNTGGMLLAMSATLAGPWMLVSGLLGRWWLWHPNEWIIVAVAVVIVIVTLCDWGYRLSY